MVRWLSCQLVADAPHGQQPARAAGFGFQLFPQMADVDPQAVLIAIVIRAPDRRAQGVVSDQMAPVLGQLPQKGQFRGRQRLDRAIFPVDQRIVQRHPAAAQPKLCAPGAGQFEPIRPLQNVLDPKQQFLHQKGFRQVIVCAQTQPEQPVRVGIAGREEQRRNIRPPPQGTEQREAVAVRQVDIQHHQFRRLGFERRLGRGAVRGSPDGAVARAGQLFAEQPKQVRVVVHQQQFGIIDRIHCMGAPLVWLFFTIPQFFRRKWKTPKI